MAILRLSRHLEEKLPNYMQPRSIRKLQRLPLTLSGKIDRKKVASIFKGDDFEWILKSEMAQRIENNLFSAYRAAANCTSAEVWQEGSISAIDGSPSNWPRTVFGAPELDQLDQLVVNMKTGLTDNMLRLQGF